MAVFVWPEGRFLFCCRKNLGDETRRPSKQRCIERQYTLRRECGQAQGTQWGPFGKLVIWGVKDWVEYIYPGGRSSGGNFWVIVPAPPSQEDGEFLSLCGLARICHGTGAWWALLCAMVGIVSKRLPSDQRFLHFFLCLWDLVLIRCVASC